MTARVVAIGGGHGLAVTLRAARRYAADLTAVVSVADDGGSSGRLRETTGLPRLGDIRRCLSALADPTSALGEILEHRFTGELAGHAFGNLLIAALADRLGLHAGHRRGGALVGAPARLRPATEAPVVLEAETDAGVVRARSRSSGAEASNGSRSSRRTRRRAPDVVDAIAAADQIVLGPGSLYTSVLAALALPAIREAVAASTGATWSTCATSARSSRRPPATTWPPTSTRSTTTGSSPTSSCANPTGCRRGRIEAEVVRAPWPGRTGWRTMPRSSAPRSSALLGRAGPPE